MGKGNNSITAADLFCGAGGTSSGLHNACVRLGYDLRLVAVNHWEIAISTHKENHPDARHICATIETVNPREAIPSGHLDILVASPECTHHSIARGGKPVSDQLRASAWHILRWIELLRIDNILIENVREFRDWGPTCANGKPVKRRKGETYQAFLSALRSMNYTVEDRVLNAADYGDPTSRSRLFIMARRGKKKIVWPSPTHGDTAGPDLFGNTVNPYRTAREIIDWNLPGESIFRRRKPLSKATLNRIAAGLKKYGGKNAEPFLVMLYGTNDVRSVDRPTPTITAGGNHIGLCSPFVIHTNHSGGDRAHNIDKPLPTVTCGHRGEMALIEPFLLQQQSCGSPRTVDQPVPTIATKGAIALVEPFVIPIDNASNGASGARSVHDPLGTIITQSRFGLCEPFITKYYGSAKGAVSINKPLDTVTTTDRFGLVEPYRSGDNVYDIRFRMLQPHELAAAMSFDQDYKFTGNKTDQIKQIGNAVPVRTAEALCCSLLEN